MSAPMKAITAPMKKEVTATIGRASRPARSTIAMKGATRKRRGLSSVRNATTISRPLNSSVWTASSTHSTTPRPTRVSSSSNGWRSGWA